MTPKLLTTSAAPYAGFIAGAADVVAGSYGIRRDDLLGKAKAWDVVEPKAVYCWVLRKLTRISLNQIARICGVNDHNTIEYRRRAVEARRMADPTFAAWADSILARARDLLDGASAGKHPDSPVPTLSNRGAVA